MKKFVINTNGWYLRLTEEHMDWLHVNGHPGADYGFCEDDRSNPDLIACVEAVRESKRPLIEEANRLQSAVSDAEDDAEEAKTLLSEAIDALLIMLDFKSYYRTRIIGEIGKALRGGYDWSYFESPANPKQGIDSELIWVQFEEIVKVFNAHRDKFQAIDDAWGNFHKYCDDNSLWICSGEIVFNDGLAIKTYDETLFEANVRRETMPTGYDDEEYEFMELKPFITREAIASFVESGDTDGLMDYLKSLNASGIMDIRDEATSRESASRNIASDVQALFNEVVPSIT